MRTIVRSLTAVPCLGVMLLAVPLAVAGEGRGAESKPHMQGEASGSDMKARREKVQARMEEQQAKLDQLTARMNQASGNEKVEAMAALLNEMVAQRKALRDRISERMSHKKDGGDYGEDGDSKAPGASR